MRVALIKDLFASMKPLLRTRHRKPGWRAESALPANHPLCRLNDFHFHSYFLSSKRLFSDLLLLFRIKIKLHFNFFPALECMDAKIKRLFTKSLSRRTIVRKL